MSPIVSFYKGLTSDDYGRRITDVWAFSDRQLEDIHNYIQRLFPNRTPSAFVHAPLLDDATVRAFTKTRICVIACSPRSIACCASTD